MIANIQYITTMKYYKGVYASVSFEYLQTIVVFGRENSIDREIQI